MIPAALFAILAISRLGAIHAVVFGGFSSASLAQRIEASQPQTIMTASCGIEGAKGPLDYKPFIEGALEKSNHKPEKIFVWQREQLRWNTVSKDKGERNWQRCVKSARNRGLKADCVPVKSSDGIYIIYTSGTTGLPKGVLREAAGHAVGLNFSMRYLFGIHPGEVMFCASDIGWVVGHSYILYAPLLAGATTVLFEGKPVGTPDSGTFWRILAEHRVNVLFTAPTALRAIRRDDPHNHLFAKHGRNDGLRHLRALFLAGERSEPSIIRMYQSLLETHCAPNAQVIDNWWSSESGSPISGLALRPAVGTDFNSTNPSTTEQQQHRPNKNNNITALPSKPGAAGKPLPGFDVRIVSDSGTELPAGSMGNIVLALPLAPTGFTTLFRDPMRFYKGYLARFAGKGDWLDTGDAGLIDTEGYVHVLSRNDDIINVAAHRISTGAIEQAILAAREDIAECCVVGVPDALKGHLPFAFVALSGSSSSSSARSNGNGIGDSAAAADSSSSYSNNNSDDDDDDGALLSAIQNSIRHDIGPIAATLGGMIVSRPSLDPSATTTTITSKSMIPKTRSGKTLRRVLRQLVENAKQGEFDKEVDVPATVEDAGVVEVARERVREVFMAKKKLKMDRDAESAGMKDGKSRAKL